MEKERLFNEFQPVSSEDWKNKIIEDLKGADYDKKMIWKTAEGFDVNPFYRKEDLPRGCENEIPGKFPFTRGNRTDNNWLVRQDIDCADAVEANAKARKLIADGVESVAFKVKGKLVTPEYIPALLKDIDAEKTELNFNVCHSKVIEFTTLLVEYYRQCGFELENIRGSINYDPIEKELFAGKISENYTEIMKALIEATSAMPKMRCIGVNGGKLNNAGAYIAQELGYTLAWGNEYLTTTAEAGIPVDVVAKKIKFNMGISSNFFMEIAKFRAARMLWAKIVEQYSPECRCACKMIVHAETSQFNQTLFDSYVNMLRTQTEAMSAAIAGVESITVTPYNAVYEDATDFSTRIAKNQQLILKHESHIDKVSEDYSVPVLAKIPLDPSFARQCDAGLVELFEGDSLDRASDVIEKL